MNLFGEAVISLQLILDSISINCKTKRLVVWYWCLIALIQIGLLQLNVNIKKKKKVLNIPISFMFAMNFPVQKYWHKIFIQVFPKHLDFDSIKISNDWEKSADSESLQDFLYTNVIFGFLSGGKGTDIDKAAPQYTILEW